MTSTIIRRSGLTALALTLSLGVAACGSSGSAKDSGSSSATASMSASPSMSAMPSASATPSGSSPQTGAEFGPACGLIPKNGAGSFQGMSTAPVASAASANPVLKTLVAAVKAAGLVDTLNSAPAITVFAPADPAFAKIPKKDLNALLKNKPALTKVLTHHVVAGKLTPAQLPGVHKTLAGDTIKINGSGKKFTVSSTKANVICGNIQTANATVYVLDQVLMPGK